MKVIKQLCQVLVVVCFNRIGEFVRSHGLNLLETYTFLKHPSAFAGTLGAELYNSILQEA